MTTPIRILQITDCISHGSGVSAVIMNYYRHINVDRVIFDFMVNEPVDEALKQDIESKGSKIYEMPALTMKNTINYKKALERFFVEHHEYSIIHGHTPNAAAYYMPIAKKYGVPVRILHSHNSRGADSRIKRVRNRMMSRVAIANATHRFACSKVAAEYLYGSDDAFILNNAINLDNYAFDDQKRARIRNQYGIDDDIILVGHIGRMVPQKNHKFIVYIAQQMKEAGIPVKFVLLGDGPLYDVIKHQINDQNLDNMFIFTGVVNNASDYYNAMDVFILPSLYEGLPVVGVEAQAAGLPTLVSDNVTPETLMTENIKSMPIDDAGKWAEWIVENAGKRSTDANRGSLTKHGFDIKQEAKKLTDKYMELLR